MCGVYRIREKDENWQSACAESRPPPPALSWLLPAPRWLQELPYVDASANPCCLQLCSPLLKQDLSVWKPGLQLGKVSILVTKAQVWTRPPAFASLPPASEWQPSRSYGEDSKWDSNENDTPITVSGTGQRRIHTDLPALHFPARRESGRENRPPPPTGSWLQQGPGCSRAVPSHPKSAVSRNTHCLGGPVSLPAVKVSKPEILDDLLPGRGLFLPGPCKGPFASLTQLLSYHNRK